LNYDLDILNVGISRNFVTGLFRYQAEFFAHCWEGLGGIALLNKIQQVDAEDAHLSLVENKYKEE
jgi:hypothetical protein